MKPTKRIGEVIWTQEEIRNSIPEFLEIYANKPIVENDGGMKTPHMFATWFMLKKLKPENVIESGVWRGQGTWLIEKAVPEANLHCIDLNLDRRDYISKQATYYTKDFNKTDWSSIKNKANTVLFFDDHQNALDRVITGGNLGFKQFIFEDNYPVSHGDCYSLKKAFQNAGFKSNINPPTGIKNKLKRLFSKQTNQDVIPNTDDSAFLNRKLAIYSEFPPVFKPHKTRWGDDWNEENYPTLNPIFEMNDKDSCLLLFEEAIYYTWICYARLK